jgi:signal peptidase II
VKRTPFVLSIITIVLLIDQVSKIWVKLNMALGDSHRVLGWEWFQIHFTENPGMAFGMEFGGDYGKLILSLFRIVVVLFIAYFIRRLIRQKVSFLLLACISLIFAGAVGNILDSVYFGVIFSDSGSFHLPEVATFMPTEGGYAPMLYGKVVDMLYFPLFSGHWPEWMPLVGGDYFIFFQPVFNIADSSISIGVVLAILFYRRFQAEIEPSVATAVTTLPEQTSKEDSTNNAPNIE